MEDSKQKFIRSLADGHDYQEIKEQLTAEPYLVPEGTLDEWYNDPEILKEVVTVSNEIIEQAWGAMWYSIKRKAMLGSIPHSKLLIEFVTNGRKLADNKLRLVFDNAVQGIKDSPDA